MPVERNKDGSITIRDDNSVTVVAGIRRASDDKQEEKFKRWVEDCAKMVTACACTLKETEQYFLEHCDALPLALDDKRMKNFQYSVIANHFEDKLGYQPSKFSFDMTDEEIEKWQKEQNAMRQAVLDSPAERFGLVTRGYYLPHTECNAIFYEQAREKQEEWARPAIQKRSKRIEHNLTQAARIVQQDICFFFEETTEHCQSTGGGENLMQQLIIFRGVTQEDIEKRSPRFIVYICALRDAGKLPGF